MSKTIICLYTSANCGKTSTIRNLFLKLGGNKNVINADHDFVSTVNFGNKSIGFASQGDPGSTQREDVEELAKCNLDIIVTASRSRGDTVDNVTEIANKYGYTVVWISPFYFYDKTQAAEKQYSYFAEKNAECISKYIIDII
ncbi:MAG: hypothetical protein J6Y98_02165 [Bacteroidales bacterium]|nr:hypothetical protein [Bacteroidales bacterium]